jgi:hypothetical protein
VSEARTPSLDERRQLTEHLFYEMQMTFDLIIDLVETFQDEQTLVSRNAKVEALAIHVRQLVAFLWEEERGRGTDAFAADYSGRCSTPTTPLLRRRKRQSQRTRPWSENGASGPRLSLRP